MPDMMTATHDFVRKLTFSYLSEIVPANMFDRNPPIKIAIPFKTPYNSGYS